MLPIIADIETNGLMPDVSTIHLLVLRDMEYPGSVGVFRRNGHEDTIEDGAARMKELSARGRKFAFHNGIKYDLPVMKHLRCDPCLPEEDVIDTLVLARLCYSDVYNQLDVSLARRSKLPKNLMGAHSLKAWGYRLGNPKGDYTGGWERWSQEMEDYCVQDTSTTADLYKFLMATNPSPEAVRLEHDVAWLLARQERHGFCFDREKAVRLYSKLTSRKLELAHDLTKVFPPFYRRVGETVPKANNKRYGYTEGAPFTAVKLTEFNPGSRDHVALMLKRRYAWEPTEFTNDGKPKVDETTLSALKYPEAKLLVEYFTVEKRLGQLAAGKEAWLKHLRPDGRIHGSVNTNGAATGRMTHSYPNLAQVPASRSPYGHECRELFHAPEGKVLIGADADALELRDLAHFMARYDAGAYVDVVLKGKKENGTDIHSMNARALELDPKAVYHAGTGRDLAKTWFYAFIYGAGDEKLGLILTGQKGARAKRAGAKARDAFLRNLPAFGALVKAVREAAQRGHLLGLDRRVLPVRSQHAALNTLLQSAGAVAMKKALVILDGELQGRGWVPGAHYEFVANVHDEWQIEADEDKGDEIGRMAAEAIRKAGEHFKFRCPLGGAYVVGRTWADTH